MSKDDSIRQKIIYMDHHATTPLDRRVFDAMTPYFLESFGNASSTDHLYGAEAAEAVKVARKQVAWLLNADPDEIIFTSGATEANNLAIQGVVKKYISKGRHIITAVTEHKAVLETCQYLERQGWKVTYLPVDQYGLVDPDEVRKAITSQTVLISIMAANNEVGTIAPIAEIGRIAHERDVLFHADATQAAGYIPLDVEDMNIDMLSLSAHKFYGPKGIGALYVRKRFPRVRLEPQTHGGGHERGMRPGTLNVTGIVGMGKAAEIVKREMKERSDFLQDLRDYLWESILSRVEGVELNGHPTLRLPHNLNIYIPGIENKALTLNMQDVVAISAGSACTTIEVAPSHVIMALSNSPERAYQSVRFGLGRENTVSEVDRVVDSLVIVIQKLKQFVIAKPG